MRNILTAVIIFITVAISALYGQSSPYALQQDAYQYGCICNRLHNAGFHRYDVVGTNKGLYSYDGYSFFSTDRTRDIMK